jgi:hypothetical protein
MKNLATLLLLSATACGTSAHADTSMGDGSSAEASDVPHDPCADAGHLDASDFGTDGTWTIRTPDEAAALERVRSVSGALVFQGPALSTLPHLQCLERVDTLWITATPLTTLSAFSNLREVLGELQIFQNAQLTSLEGLDSLESVRWMSVRDNATLGSPRGIPSLRRSNVLLSIAFGEDAHPVSLDGFPAVAGDGELKLSGSFSNLGPLVETDMAGYEIAGPAVTSLEGLPPKTSYTRLALVGGVYEDLAPLQGVENIDYLSLVETQLRSLEGLDSLRSLGQRGDIHDAGVIRNNSALEDVSALSNLASGHRIELRDNPSLQSLEGLENVEDLHTLSIRVCPQIASLHPVLGGQMTNLESLRVTYNERIPNCEAELLCTQVPDAFCDIAGNADAASVHCD